MIKSYCSMGAVLIPNKLKKQSSGLRLLLWDCSLSALITELNELETVPKMIKKIEMSHFNISSCSSVVLGSQHATLPFLIVITKAKKHIYIFLIN